MDELIQIVDENDVAIRPGTKQEAWKNGLYHRVVRISIEDENGNVLLQKRSSAMLLYPNAWDNSVGGHVDAGEDYPSAALRELREELGITGYPLEEIKYYKTQGVYQDKTMNRYVRLYRLKIPSNTKIILQKSEVAETKWFTHDELKDLVTQHSHTLSDGLIETFEILYA